MLSYYKPIGSETYSVPNPASTAQCRSHYLLPLRLVRVGDPCLQQLGAIIVLTLYIWCCYSYTGSYCMLSLWIHHACWGLFLCSNILKFAASQTLLLFSLLACHQVGARDINHQLHVIVHYLLMKGVCHLFVLLHKTSLVSKKHSAIPIYEKYTKFQVCAFNR